MKTEESETRQKVVFLHIPKTGGSTLYGIIDRYYERESTYTIGIDGSIDDFKNLSVSRRSEIRMLRGHHGFGLHEFLPGPSVHFTLLRDPVDRVISYYYFLLRRPQDPLHDIILANNMSLRDFVESRIPEMVDNGQTRLLSGEMEWAYEVAFGGCTEETLEAAKRNLRQHFRVVGLTERFDETLLLLREAFGWQNIFYARQKVAPDRPRKEELSQAAVEAIMSVNLLDAELYQYATTLFEGQVLQQGRSFAREVKSFQRANQRLSPFVHAWWEIRKVSVRVIARRWIRHSLEGKLFSS